MALFSDSLRLSLTISLSDCNLISFVATRRLASTLYCTVSLWLAYLPHRYVNNRGQQRLCLCVSEQPIGLVSGVWMTESLDIAHSQGTVDKMTWLGSTSLSSSRWLSSLSQGLFWCAVVGWRWSLDGEVADSLKAGYSFWERGQCIDWASLSHKVV
jgi:hypothetical protein